MSQKICRLCLNPLTIAHSLCNKNIAPMYKSITSKEVPDSKQGSNICPKCLMRLKLAYNIQQDFLRNHDRLTKSQLVKLTAEKIEPNLGIEILNPPDCVFCPEVFEQEPSRINSHVKIHFEATLSCPICKSNCTNLEQYRQHLYFNPVCIEQSKTEFECTDCKYRFKYRSLFELHKKNFHRELGNSFCKLCNETFATTKMKQHNQKHMGQNCDGCKVVIIGSVKEHLRKHHPTIDAGDNRICCEICGILVLSRRGMLQHHKMTHGIGKAENICEKCGKSYCSKQRLRMHVDTVHLNLKRFSCTVCSIKLKTKEGLKLHVLQHTNANPHKCDLCDKEFKQRVSLRAHLRIKHQVIEPTFITCEICGRNFSSLLAIRTHKAWKHKKNHLNRK